MTAFRNRVELSVTPLECRRLLSISASYIGQATPNEGGAMHDTVSFTTGLVSDGIADYCITVTGLDLNKNYPILGREPGRGWDILHGGKPTTRRESGLCGRPSTRRVGRQPLLRARRR